MKQKGYIHLNFTGIIIGFIIVGVVIGISINMVFLFCGNGLNLF